MYTLLFFNAATQPSAAGQADVHVHKPNDDPDGPAVSDTKETPLDASTLGKLCVYIMLITRLILSWAGHACTCTCMYISVLPYHEIFN